MTDDFQDRVGGPVGFMGMHGHPDHHAYDHFMHELHEHHRDWDWRRHWDDHHDRDEYNYGGGLLGAFIDSFADRMGANVADKVTGEPHED